jgi:type VI secretion system protein ImpB
MSESIQKKKERVRPPRVHLVCEVETNGAMVLKEVPFVASVLADLAGDKKRDKKLKDREFATIDRDNFDSVLAGIAPELRFRAENTLAGDGSELAVELKFQSMKDFSPEQIAAQIPALKALLETREKLVDLKSRADGNDRLEELLNELLANEELRKKAGGALGGDGAGGGGDGQTPKA